MYDLINNLKKTSSLLAFYTLFTFSAPSLAYVGFYIGGGANYNWFDANYSANNYIDDPIFGPEDVGRGSGSLSGDNTGGQVIAGYTWGCTDICKQKYYVSLEGFAEFYALKNKANWESPQNTITLNQSLDAQLKNGFGVTLKPGIALTNRISAFGIVGYVYSQLDDIVYDTDLDLFNNSGIAHFKKKGLSGLRLGLGTKYNMTQNVSAELSWAINFYQNYDQLNKYVTGQPDGSIYYEKVEMNSMRNSQLLLNLIYYFD